jgi:hypothetical protein
MRPRPEPLAAPIALPLCAGDSLEAAPVFRRRTVWLFRSKDLADRESDWLEAHGHGPCEVHPNGQWFVVRRRTSTGLP